MNEKEIRNEIDTFFKCLIKNKLEKAKKFIEKGYDVNNKDNKGSTALYHLCSESMKDDNIEMFKLLLDHGAEVFINEFYRYKHEKIKNTPLHAYCMNNKINIDVLRLLISKGADIILSDSNDKTFIYYLLKNPNFTFENLKLLNGYSIDDAIEGLSVSQNISLDSIKLLINKGARIEEEIYFKICSNINTSVDILEFILNDVFKKDKEDEEVNNEAFYGKSLLNLISNDENKTVNKENFLYILLKKADVNSTDYFGESSLHYMCHKKELNLEIIEILLENGANPNLKDKKKSFYYNYMSKNNKLGDNSMNEESGINIFLYISE
eukprot:TRINITY_DN3463_c0_g1_i1.p1 TRINITY_DN3463_c0_g1~~TRINITY_DN3463_c0_g1_i1.p1  ORF type:complete len:332 (+),score=97.72 TRINITY_DN3463_c0_g1_i1:29-997(+)